MNILKRNNGFTLIEIIIAIAVVGILGVSVMAFFGNSARFIRETDVREQAVLISQKEMESAKAVGYSPTATSLEIPYTADGAYPKYTVNIVKSIESAGLNKITVKTTWENSNVSLVSYIAER